MVNTSTDNAWRIFGEADPYFGVLTQPKYRRELLDENGLADFFKSGEDYVAGMLQHAAQHAPTPRRFRRVLDFGCGVGRLAIPLAAHSDSVVGVDISPGMLREAQVNAERIGAKNVRFLLTPDWLESPDEQFDLVHSFIVLQHIPVNRGVQLIRTMVSRIAPGGIGVLHLTYAQPRMATRLNYWLRRNVPFSQTFVNLIRRRPLSTPAMQMNRYDLNVVLKDLQEYGVADLHVQFTDHGGNYGVTLLFASPGAGACTPLAA